MTVTLYENLALRENPAEHRLQAVETEGFGKEAPDKSPGRRRDDETRFELRNETYYDFIWGYSSDWH